MEDGLRRRCPASSSAKEAVVRIDAYPNQTFSGVVTEVGSSPISGTAYRLDFDAIKFKVEKVRIKNPPPSIKARPLRAGRHPHRFPLAGPGGAHPRRWRWCATSSTSPACRWRPTRRTRKRASTWWPAARRGSSPCAPALWATCPGRGRGGLHGGETLVTGPFRALRTLHPGDAVSEQKTKPADDREGSGG